MRAMRGTDTSTPPDRRASHANRAEDRGALPGEPCRCCGRAGGVYFVIDDSPHGQSAPQVVACDLCGGTWDVCGRAAR